MLKIVSCNSVENVLKDLQYFIHYLKCYLPHQIIISHVIGHFTESISSNLITKKKQSTYVY